MKSSTTLAALVAHCRKLTRRQPTPDAELLRRFVSRRDHAAFEELLECYAPLVWGVCRRIVRIEADCEDAFQAVFLVLFRQAGTIDPQRPLGAWLHGVAVHAAHKAAARSARQPTLATVPERASSGDIAEELGNRELFRIVDEEIARLPALLREPFVLCCIEGRTRDEAAAALGCSVTAIKGRLERSRNLLRQRLERRGFGLPAAFLVLGLTSSQVCASLRTKALHCVLGSVPSAVAALLPTAGASLTSKLTLTAMSFVMVGVLGFGAFHVMQTESPQEPPTPAKKSPQSPVAEKPQPRLDRFGDPLPPGAIRRFGTLRLRHDYPIRYLAFTPDSKQIIGGKSSVPLAVFEVASGRRLRTIGTSTRGNYGFAISPDGKRVVCGGSGKLWDLQTGKLIRELGDDTGRWDWYSVAFSPDGKIIAAAGDRGAEIRMVEADTGKQRVYQTLKEERTHPPQYQLSDLEFSPDGKFLAARFSEWKVLERKNNPPSVSITETPKQIWLLDAVKGTLVRTIGSAEDAIYNFAFQPNTGRLAAIGRDGAIRFWDVKTGKEVHRLAVGRKGETLRILRFLDGGRHCALSACEDKSETESLIIVDVKDGRELRRLKLRENRWVAAPVALSPDGRMVATANNFREACVRVWDVQSGVERLADAGHRTAATLSLSADGRTLISRGHEGRMIHWDLRTGNGHIEPAHAPQEDRPFYTNEEEWSLRGPRWQLAFHRKTSEMEARSRDGSKLLRKVKWPSARWWDSVLSPDGTHLAASIHDDGNNAVLLWEPEREKEPRKLTELPAGFDCRKLLFSHDGNRLIVGGVACNASLQNVLWEWDVAGTKVVRKFPIQSAPDHMILSGDDRRLIVGSGWGDPTVHVWDVETGKERATLTDLLLPPMEPGKNERRCIAGLRLSADERFLAVVTHRGDSTGISVWDTASWKPLRTFPWTRLQNEPSALLFSRAGRSLFVANSDTTILEWDVARQFDRKTEVPNKDRLNILWQTLIETPDKAYPAVWEMLDHPAESVPFLIDKLSPVKPVEEKRVRQLLAQLDSESFAEREEASRKLLALGEQIVPMLRQALKDRPSLEMKKRIEGAIESLNRLPPPEQLRLLRALAVLEWSDRSDAVEHIRRLAGGAPSASLTQAARAAWQRRRK